MKHLFITCDKLTTLLMTALNKMSGSEVVAARFQPLLKIYSDTTEFNADVQKLTRAGQPAGILITIPLRQHLVPVARWNKIIE